MFLQVLLEKKVENPLYFYQIALSGWPGEGRDMRSKWEEPVPIPGDAAVGERDGPFEQGKNSILWVFRAPTAAQCSVVL